MWYSWFIMIKPISVLPHLLNWISCWIEFFLKIFELNIFLNWICLKIFELNNFLNWIFVKNIELDNFLNWIFVKYYWIEYWIESFFGKIQILNWINLGIAHPYSHHTLLLCFGQMVERVAVLWVPQPNY